MYHHTVTTYNVDNWNAWVENLRTTTSQQAQGTLCRVDGPEDEPVISFCCLGLGSWQADIVRFERDNLGGNLRAYEFGEQHAMSLAPFEFIEWLGLMTAAERDRYISDAQMSRNSEFDITFDVPIRYTDPRTVHGDNALPLNLRAADLNDSGHGFKQIADVAAYFGPIEVTW